MSILATIIFVIVIVFMFWDPPGTPGRKRD